MRNGRVLDLYPSQNEGARIRALREEKGLTLEDAAIEAGVGERLLYGIENWGWVTLPRLAKRIGKALGWPKDIIKAVTGPDVTYDDGPELQVGDSGLMIRRRG